MAAIRKCHIELANKKSFRDIEASKDAVEAAWNEFNHATARFCMHAGGDLSQKELDEQPEEARRAWYEWKALSNMMDEVVDKAEEYLEESATKENSRDELCEDEDGGNELDAKVEIQRWVEQLSTMSKVNEVALEVSAANEVNANEVNDVNKVNEESTVNEESGVMLNAKEEAPEVSIRESNEVELHVAHNEVKEEMSKGKPLEVKRRGSFAAKSEVRTSWEPGESDAAMFDEVKSEVKSDVNVEAKVEVFGMKEVKNLKDDNKVEVFDAKVNSSKVGLRLSKKEARLRCDVTMKALLNAMTLCNFVRLYISEMLVLDALNAARFVDVKPVSSRCFAESFPPILSDYG